MQKNKLYVGNLDYSVTSKELVDLFSQFGGVVEVMVVPDKTRKDMSKGYGFVTFASDEEAGRALSLNDQEYKGRKLVVQLAKAPEVKSETTESKPVTIYENKGGE